MNKKNKKIFKLILLIVGCAIFSVLVYEVGPSTIYHQLIVLKWKVLLLLLPFSLVFVLDTMGWKYAFTNSKISFKDLFLIRIAGESLNWIIPSANFAGEPMKAYFLKKHNIPMAEGMASVVISKTILLKFTSSFFRNSLFNRPLSIKYGVQFKNNFSRLATSFH